MPGPVAVQLRTRFRAATAGEDPRFERWLHFVDAG